MYGNKGIFFAERNFRKYPKMPNIGKTISQIPIEETGSTDINADPAK
jgi:hypothetical protein